MIATINLIVLRHLDADGPRMMVIIFITGHIKQESLSLFDTKHRVTYLSYSIHLGKKLMSKVIQKSEIVTLPSTLF